MPLEALATEAVDVVLIDGALPADGTRSNGDGRVASVPDERRFPNSSPDEDHRFGVDRMVDEYLEVYRRILAT